MKRYWVIAALLAACSKQTGPDVSVELSGVTLADDCGDAARPPKPPTIVAKRRAADQAPAAVEAAAGACPQGVDCSGPSQPPCEQTSMQLSVRAGVATTIAIQRVELLDASGKVVDELAASKPTRWDDFGNYFAWDEKTVAGKTLATSYTLSSPRWDKVTKGGRWEAHTKTFKLRVTVRIGDAEKTVEKQSITPVMLEPPVAT